MPRIQIITVKSVQHLQAVVLYVARSDKCMNHQYIGMCNMLMGEDNESELLKVDQFLHNDFNKCHAKRRGIHLIIEFSPEECQFLNQQVILQIGYWLSATYFANHVTYFAVHNHTELFHLDMLVFPVNMMNGEIINYGKPAWYYMVSQLEEYLKAFVPIEKIGKPLLCFGRT